MKTKLKFLRLIFSILENWIMKLTQNSIAFGNLSRSIACALLTFMVCLIFIEYKPILGRPRSGKSSLELLTRDIRIAKVSYALFLTNNWTIFQSIFYFDNQSVKSLKNLGNRVNQFVRHTWDWEKCHKKKS